MRFSDTPTFRKNLLTFSKPIRRKFRKQAQFLLDDIRHPSLHAKKYDESRGIWQARVACRSKYSILFFDRERYVYLAQHQPTPEVVSDVEVNQYSR